MLSRRDILQLASAAAGAAVMSGGWGGRALAQQRLTQDDLLSFKPMGNVSLLHITDLHAQLVPIYFREPSINLGAGNAKGAPPHVTGKAFLDKFGITPASTAAYTLTDQDFVSLAKIYGRVGGLDRIATIIKALRAERGERALFLDGGDTWTNSYTSLITKGQDVVDCMSLLKPDAMTAHWEFTLGETRVKEIVESLGFPFLAQNVRDAEWDDEEVFQPSAVFERGGVKIAVIGQAFPYTPIANPRWMMQSWSFGIREEALQKQVEALREAGANLVVLLSHNGFDVDRKLAGRVPGINVILTGHTHDALPDIVKVGKTLLVASGSHGKFVSCLDLDVQEGEIKNYQYRLIPVLSEVIAPDKAMAAKIKAVRAPHEKLLSEVIGQTETLLYRRGNFNGTLDDVICDALLRQRDAEISLSPGFRWGSSLLPGQNITREDIYNATAITYPEAYRTMMPGGRLKDILEDVADNLFNPDPYYQQGGDMVRVGGLTYTIDISKPAGSRISELTLVKSGKPVEAEKEYAVSGWASVSEGTEGPPIWDVVFADIKDRKIVAPKEGATVKIQGT